MMMPRRRKSDPPSMAWLLTFADLVSLMITFFVMLYAFKSVDIKRWHEIRGALSGALSLSHAVAETHVDEQTLENIKLLNSDSLDYIETLLQQRFADDTQLKDAKLRRDTANDTLTIVLPSQLLFNTGSDEVIPAGRKALSRLGDMLRHLDNQILIAGYTDPTPIQGGRFDSNWELSIMRAVSVLKQLHSAGVTAPMEALGLADSRMSMINSKLPRSYRYMLARRVEIVISGKASKRGRYY